MGGRVRWGGPQIHAGNTSKLLPSSWERSTLVTKMMAEHLLQGQRGQVHTYSVEPVTVTESKLTLLGHMIGQ